MASEQQDMLSIVAAALAKAQGFPESAAEDQIGLARAAVQVMVKPTKEAVEAGAAAIPGSVPDAFAIALSVWRAMTEHILSSQDASGQIVRPEGS